MPPRRLHRSTGPRRPADWPPPVGNTTCDPSGDSLRPPAMIRLLTPALLGLLLVAPLTGASAVQPRLLGCWIASVDHLMPRSAFSSPSDGVDCAELCSTQEALLAVVSPGWCFCLNQPASAADLTANCSGAPPPGLELLHVYSVTDPSMAAGGSSVAATSSVSGGSLSSVTTQPTFVRCALSSGENGDTQKGVDACVHFCSTEQSGGFMALGPSRGVSEFYRCSCSAEDEFGASLNASICDQHCSRPGQVLGMTCGGELSDGGTALSVYQLADENPGSTPTPVTTRRSTGHYPSVSGITDSACPDGGYRVEEGSCYQSLPVNGHASKPNDPLAYQDAVDACAGLSTENEWRPWAVETQEERNKVFDVLLVDMGWLQDDNNVATSGMAREGGTIVWDGWPGDSPADWLQGGTAGVAQPDSVLVWGNIQSMGAEDTTMTFFEPTSLPNPLAVICELPTAGTTVSTTESTTSSPTTTDPSSTPDTSSASTSTVLPPSSTTEPGPGTPDDVINDLIDDLNQPSSNITDTDVIDTVAQLDDILQAQMSMTYDLPPYERLENDTKFTMDLVQLVDTLLGATDAWSNMTQSQSEATFSELMDSTEAAGFLLANSTAVADTDDVIETSQPSLVLSASSVDSSYGGSFQFPQSAEAPCWIRLPEGYVRESGQAASGRLSQVGLLYRSEVMSLLMTPGNNSMADAEKRLNSPVLSFSLGGVGRRVQLPGGGARMQLQYSLTEREPAQKDIWRHLHPGEQPSAVKGTAVCAYWNDTLSEWSTDGCHLEVNSSSKHHASCVCSHLTNFAILMDYHDYVGTPQSLNILTWVLGSLSLVGLVITWIVFTCNRSLHCTRTTITRNLCATYFVGLALLLTLMDRQLVYLEPVACTVVGMAIHYSFLAVFAWTMVEGIHLYKVLRHVFEPKSNSMTRYYIYGYLIPALIVIVTTAVALSVDQYAYVRDEFCWLTIPYFIWFYNGPIAVVLLMNMFVLILAYRSAASLKVNQLRAKTEKMKRWLKGWFSLSCLLGIQWAIGYIYVDGSNVFDYVFTVLNCSQGLLIFLFHCVLREKARQILLGRFSTAKRSTMMNSVYGQMVIAERKKKEYRQSRMSHDTCVTTLSNAASPANSESPDSSPASERSSSSSQGSSGSRRSSNRKSLTRGISGDSQMNNSLRGRVNLAFQPDEPRCPLPDITEETDGAGSPRHRPAPAPGRGSRGGCVPPAIHTDSMEIYRSNSVAALRHGKAH